MTKTTTGPICVWDITIPMDKTDIGALKGMCGELCKKWCFQLEKGKTTGYLHWQCRVSLHDKLRKDQMIQTDLGSIGNCRPTSKPGALNANFYNYCTKDMTREEGPWTDKDVEKHKTKQLAMFESFELYDWQKSVVDMSTQFCMRSIDIIYDMEGNIGKSIFGEWMEFVDLAEEIPPYRLMDDIFAWVYGMTKRPCYFVDLPRGMKKDKLADFYSGIEVIKNGVAYDKRYRSKKDRFDRPRIFVFTNELPNFALMSKDRWNVWVVKDKKLCAWEETILGEESVCNTDEAL